MAWLVRRDVTHLVCSRLRLFLVCRDDLFSLQASCLRFGGEVMESDSMRTQLSTLATQLQKAVNLVKPVEKTSQQQRAAFFGQVVSAVQCSGASQGVRG